jgi:hypothetical protein
VNVHHVGPALAKGAKKFRVRLRAPHNLPGEEHPSWRPPVFDLLAKSLEPPPQCGRVVEGRRLVVDHLIFAAR